KNQQKNSTIIDIKMTKYLSILVVWLLISTSSAMAFSDNFSQEEISEEQRQENLDRTQNLIDTIETYLRNNDTFVGIMSRRGAGDPETGVSDTDSLDLTGMAHTGFIIRSGFSKKADYITFNLVRKKGAKKVGSEEYDLSELKVWSLPNFFIGSFEKDAIVFLPKKKVQLKLWNLLRANGALDIEKKKRYLKDAKGKQLVDDKGTPRFLTDLFIKNGAFALLHNPEYNLLSDYTEISTQNCNELLLKTYIGIRDFWQLTEQGADGNGITDAALRNYRTQVAKSIEASFTPSQMILSRTKSTFAFTQNIRFGERHKESPSFLGLKLKREKFNVVGVDSFCDPKNQKYLDWSDFKVFREKYDSRSGWSIEDWGKNYVKVNRLTGRKNEIELK
ncbi:hypothetical protein VU04_10045, partial [Desulfobulbus sp. TB]|nr:hypothetical protein [Desulfobulbus sp. TB]